MNPAMMIAAALGILAVAADVWRRRIPNWLTGSGALGGMICAACAGWQSLGWAAAGLVAGFLIWLPFHARGGTGGGDVKLMAAFGAVLGFKGILLAAVFAALAGALLAGVALVWKPRTAAIPYAPAIVLGAWISMLGGS